MKRAVAYLEPFMEKVEGAEKGKIVLATVKGDVHDIGKNLVDIILTNNGYKVVNLGIKQPIENMIAEYQKHDADAIGMSGLLVKSTVVMKEDLVTLNERGLAPPVILGGAALNRRYVEEDLRAIYRGELFYGEDAFDGLRIMDQLAARKKLERVGSAALKGVVQSASTFSRDPKGSARAPLRVAAKPLLDFKNTLDLDGHVPGQRVVPDRTPSTDARVLAEHVLHQLREPVDHLRLVEEVVRAVDHAVGLEQPLHLVERPEGVLMGGEDVGEGFGGGVGGEDWHWEKDAECQQGNQAGVEHVEPPMGCVSLGRTRRRAVLRNQPLAALNAAAASSMVASMSASVWAAETNQASNWEGGSMTPVPAGLPSSMTLKKRA